MVNTALKVTVAIFVKANVGISLINFGLFEQVLYYLNILFVDRWAARITQNWLSE